MVYGGGGHLVWEAQFYAIQTENIICSILQMGSRRMYRTAEKIDQRQWEIANIYILYKSWRRQTTVHCQ